MVEIERLEFLEGAYLRVSFLLFRKKMPLQDSTNKQTRSPRRDVKDVLGRRSRDRGEGLSTLTPRVNDNFTLNRVLRESARQSPERQLLRRRLDGIGLRENEVDGDGNCQFRAIADQLYGSSDRYAEVRANIVEHLRSNSSRYSAFVPDSYDTYIENMGRDETWGDHVTLQAASNVYGLEIRVYTSYDGNWERVIRPTDDGNIRGAIQLSFYAEFHYNSVYPNSEVDTQMRDPQRGVRRNEARAHSAREFKKNEENFVMHHLYGMSIESDDELYIDDEDGASDEDVSQDESYSSSDPIQQTQIQQTQILMEHNFEGTALEAIQPTQEASGSREPPARDAQEIMTSETLHTEHTPDLVQLLDMIRCTAEANNISPEEMHRRVGQQLNVNNTEQPLDGNPTRRRFEHQRSNCTPYARRRRRRRAVLPGQTRISSYYGGNAEPGTVSSDNDIISISDSPNQARLRRTISKPQVPHSVEELYNVWEKTARDLLEGNTSPYSNFLHAFGDDTNEGTVSRRQEMTEIGKILFDFKSRGGKPGQPAMLKGREREGKTVALFSITLAALLLDMRVVILCAPNKIAPVVDMVKKLERAGFSQMFETRHTLGAKATRELGLRQSEVGSIFVAALGTIGDLKKVKSYIIGQRKDRKFTVTLLDECDELTQGKGQQYMHIEDQNDPSSYQKYIPLESRGEDDVDVPIAMSQQDASLAKNKKENLATACTFFGNEIKPMTQLFACSATLSGCIMNPIGLFNNNEVTRFFKVYPKPGFTGIDKYSIPEGCELEADGNMSLNTFKESSAVQKMLQKFFDRRNECDGTQLVPMDHSGANPVALRGMLFVSVSNRVNGMGGVKDFAEAINDMSNSMYKNSTLFICCVGNPCVLFAGKWVSVASGTSFEDIYNKTARRARQGKFPGLSLQPNIPFSSICKHVILIGYNLTRRAMTAAFTPADEPNVLCKLQYLIFTASKSITIDTVSQRVTRASHDFAQHIVPNNYSVDVCMQPNLLDKLKRYRKMEDDMVEMQRRELNTHCKFRQKIEVYRNNLSGIKISKRGLELTDLSETGRAIHDRERMNAYINENMRPYLDGYRKYLEQYKYKEGQNLKKYASESVNSYFLVVRRYFLKCDTIQDVAIKCKGIESEYGTTKDGGAIPTEHHNELQSSRRFLEYYERKSIPELA